MARNETSSLQEFQLNLRDGTYSTLSNYDTSSGKATIRSYTGFRPSFAPVIPPPDKHSNKIDKSDKTKSQELAYLCYNLDSAVYIYRFNGRPLHYMNFVDRKMYTSDPPVCMAASTEVKEYLQLELLIATKSGTILNFNPFSRTSVYYNEDHCIEGSKETRPTHIAWIPQSINRFAVSFTSKILLILTTKYKVPGVPHTNPTIDTSHFSFYPARAKKTVLKMKLRIGTDALNHFAFSADGKQIATASSDGFLRLFSLKQKPIQMCGRGRSNFGGVLCVCWSPDEKYLATGTEDDLVTIWSSTTLLPLTRCFGHRSWVSCVMFDPFYIPTNPGNDPSDNFLLSAGRERNPSPDDRPSKTPLCRLQSLARVSSLYPEIAPTYRLGSVGQDGKFFLWEFSDDDLKPSVVNISPRRVSAPSPVLPYPNGASCMNGESNKDHPFINSASDIEVEDHGIDNSDRRNKSKDKKKPVKNRSKVSHSPILPPTDLCETQPHPSSSQVVSRLEPVVEKSIFDDRLTSIHFDKNFIFVSSYCGRILCWERPVKESVIDVKEQVKEPLENHVMSKPTHKSSKDS
ncbi:WD repeat-containing protein 20 isoform X1 [Oopsacas minuta]|uniref:WD repeat-containing protein 20 isoform X1 n=1 Tax=Oopsacas minuta TaxID=111878 RepID=A0AAV7KA45_9METZ|nr:WD repeat-containing protein 20 isoform X1 [Oopsacas minuta]